MFVFYAPDIYATVGAASTLYRISIPDDATVGLYELTFRARTFQHADDVDKIIPVSDTVHVTIDVTAA
jgi:hypothetical protein